MATNPNAPIPDEGAGIDRARGETSAFDGQSTIQLVRRLIDDLGSLFRKEMALATSEISRSMTAIQAGVASIATGGAVLFAGFLVLLLAVAAALAEVVDTWLALLIVGGVVAVVGFIMLSAGRKKLKNSTIKPEKAQAAVREDAEMVRRKMQ
jgi:hypothetical protein